uniref:Transposase Tc1-like domain-containing protein n=1 Tax=Oncorhynchus tshawytscha TaxID=74940 RepID=A0AAZ3S2D0_ONCTS
MPDRYRMATTTACVTPAMHNPSISAKTVRNRLRGAGLRACWPVVRQVLTRHHRQQRHLWAHKPTDAGPDRTGKKVPEK